MDNTFEDTEEVYRAVLPPSHPGLFWKKNGHVSPSAFADPNGLSVERGYYRDSVQVINKMKKSLTGCIISLTVKRCKEVDAVVKYLPSKVNKYHSEIHKSDTEVLLSKSQRFHLAESAKVEYMEE